MKILFLTNIPSPYMVGYLNELGKYSELMVVFEKAFDETRPKTWKNLLFNANFKYYILDGKSVNKRIYGDKMDSAPDDKAISFEVIKFLKNKNDFIIVANPCTPTGIIAITYMKMKKIRYSIQSEGGYPGNGKGIKERVKFFLMNKAEYYFSTCDMDDKYFMQYGADPKRIRRYPFASIYEKDLPKGMICEKEKKAYRDMLNIKEDKIVLCVGRSVYVKGFDILLRSVKNMDSDVGVYFVGGECTDEYKSIIQELKLKNIYFVDNVIYDELKRYYYAADVFVLPTRSDTWGLVINEAMTYGLPVVTTDKCVAGNALIENGVNGYIVNVEDYDTLSEKIKILLNNKELRYQFGRINSGKMRTWTFENMGKVMYRHLEDIMGEKND